MKSIFVTGSTGFVGSRLCRELLHRGKSVRALTRKSSLWSVPVGALPVVGNALEASSFASAVPPGATVVHLVGVAHPAPWKARAFREIDLVAARAAIAAAQSAGAGHFVYVSVAHPAPVMKDYITVRMECESLLERSGLPYTILRPWYVLGPGHRWPWILKPLYTLGERFPATAESSRRLGLVTIDEMVQALAGAVEQGPPVGVSGAVWEVPKIREMGRTKGHAPGPCTRTMDTDQATTGSVRNFGRSDGSAV